LIRFFIQSQLERRRDYAVYFFDPVPDPEFNDKISKLRKSDPATDGHAGERETSTLLYLRPDVVKMDRAETESGANQKPVAQSRLVYGHLVVCGYRITMRGRGQATRELGQALTEHRVGALVKALRVVKADTKTLQLKTSSSIE
jgi:creatinine amidohydrolase